LELFDAAMTIVKRIACQQPAASAIRNRRRYSREFREDSSRFIMKYLPSEYFILEMCPFTLLFINELSARDFCPEGGEKKKERDI